MDLIEEWWNGTSDRRTRVDLYLRYKPGGLWEVRWTIHQKDRYVEYATEAEAHTFIDQLKCHYGQPGEDWRRQSPMPAPARVTPIAVLRFVNKVS